MRSIVMPAVLAVLLAVAGGVFWPLGKAEQRLADVAQASWRCCSTPTRSAESRRRAVAPRPLVRRVPVARRRRAGRRARRARRGRLLADATTRRSSRSATPAARSPKPIPTSCCSPPTPRSAPARPTTDRNDAVRRLDARREELHRGARRAPARADRRARTTTSSPFGRATRWRKRKPRAAQGARRPQPPERPVTTATCPRARRCTAVPGGPPADSRT